MEIIYRQLNESEATRIRELRISNFIKRAWRKVNGTMKWVEINWKDNDFPDGYENHLEALKTTFRQGGYVLGAFDGELLVGFCSINREMFGHKCKYVLLDQIFLSTAYQRKGIGKTLFNMCAIKAREWGGDKFYICAGSAAETLAFYNALGCEDAKEINNALFSEDENDLQLEYVL